MKPATAARVVERWWRAVGGQAGPEEPATPLIVPTDGVRLQVDVVGMPELAAALAEFSRSAWDVRAVDDDCSVSRSAQAVVLHAPGGARVARVRTTASCARLIAMFDGPAPGPARDEALRAGVDDCLKGSSVAVVAAYLGHLAGPPAMPPAGADVSDGAPWGSAS